MNLKNLKQMCIEQSIPLIEDEIGEFLAEVIKTEKPKIALEIGTALGYSGLLIFTNMKVYSTDASLTTIELNKERAQQAKENLKDTSIEIINDSATNYLKILKNQNKKFDLVFLDGPKSQYKNYLDTLVRLLNVGGVLVADNVFFHGLVDLPIVKQTKNYSEEEFNNRSKDVRALARKLREFAIMCQSDSRLYCKIIAKADGILFAKKLKD